MIKKIKNFVMIAMLTSSLAAPSLVVAGAGTAIAAAACGGVSDSIQDGVNKSTGGSDACGTGGGLTDSSVGSVGKEIVTIFSEIVGVISIIMIVYGGFRYITSGGDANRVGAAKNTIVYAVVGLIIVALAQAIIHYVLTTSHTATAPAPTGG